MHNKISNKYYFINKFDTNLIDRQDKNTAIIYRNYNSFDHKNYILSFKNYCKKKGYKFYLSNNIKLAVRLGLDGAYLPSFNKEIKHLSYSLPKNFLIIGSAHNYKEIKIKEKQGVKIIFLSSLFKKNKNYLGINKFKLISKFTKKNIIALGGISKNNLKKLNILNCFGFAAISYFEQKKRGPLGPLQISNSK
jgi:thiamine-phosphate pyrophosphorylase|tara:strand:- start:792 stop:1367 length:576 start_codon:yes stop_codon:yes gene_type:complete